MKVWIVAIHDFPRVDIELVTDSEEKAKKRAKEFHGEPGTFANVTSHKVDCVVDYKDGVEKLLEYDAKCKELLYSVGIGCVGQPVPERVKEAVEEIRALRNLYGIG